jgi:hypothetical protein
MPNDPRSFMTVEMSLKVDVGELQSYLDREQLTAVMAGIALVLNAGKVESDNANRSR